MLWLTLIRYVYIFKTAFYVASADEQTNKTSEASEMTETKKKLF